VPRTTPGRSPSSTSAASSESMRARSAIASSRLSGATSPNFRARTATGWSPAPLSPRPDVHQPPPRDRSTFGIPSNAVTTVSKGVLRHESQLEANGSPVGLRPPRPLRVVGLRRVVHLEGNRGGDQHSRRSHDRGRQREPEQPRGYQHLERNVS